MPIKFVGDMELVCTVAGSYLDRTALKMFDCYLADGFPASE